MTRKPPPDISDPTDGLLSSGAGDWAMEKHRELARYVDATWAARAKWNKWGESSYVDLYCGPGRQYVEETAEFIDGSSLVAWKSSTRRTAPFHRVVISDAKPEYVSACQHRLTSLGAQVRSHVGRAETSSAWAASNIDKRGLQLAFLDPFNLKHMPWSVFPPLVALPHIDLIVHFSQADLARNLDRYFADDDSVLDAFAPGWRKAVDRRDKVLMRGRFLEYWKSLFEAHGFKAAGRVPLITTKMKVPLYRLVFFSRHPFPKGIWDSLDTNRQKHLFG